MNLEKIQKFLEKEGFSPEINEKREIHFKYEGGSYLIEAPENDPTYIRIIFPNFWKINDENERSKIIQNALDATQYIKAAKIVLSPTKDNLWGTIETFLPDEEQFILVFKRNMAALQGAVKRFAVLMQPSQA